MLDIIKSVFLCVCSFLNAQYVIPVPEVRCIYQENISLGY